MPPLNPLVTGIVPPPIPEAHGWAQRYDGTFGPLLDLCQAVPGYLPHPDLLQHLSAAAAEPVAAKYGLINGDAALREVYAADLSRTYGGTVGPSQIAITAGCNQAFFLAMMTLAQSGDAVLLPTPWFWNHQQTLEMLGIEARPLPCTADNAFIPDPGAAEALLDAHVRAIVLITPNNPTGAVYPPDVIARFQDLCQRRGIWLILDETYRDFLPVETGPRARRFHRPGLAGDGNPTLQLLEILLHPWPSPGRRHRRSALSAGVHESAGLHAYLPATRGTGGIILGHRRPGRLAGRKPGDDQ